MRTRRFTGAALGAIAVAALATAGCTAEDTAAPGGTTTGTSPAGSGSVASSAAADPAAAAALGQAAAALGTTSFKLTLTAGPSLEMTGTVDAPNGRGSAEVRATGPNTDLTVQTRLDGQDLFVQVPGVTKAGTWTRIDVSRLPEGANVGLRPGQIDPVNTAQLLSSTTDVRESGSRSYAGTLDLTKVAGVAGVDKVTVDGYGADAQRVPFTAGLDEQGRLSELTIQLPPVNGQPAAPIEVLYTDYGVPVESLRPDPSTIVEAPESLYSTLGGR
ncbi:MAG TPA: hypothetical protein VFH03_23455 [Actinoplanes sp.]|nr:hypothetical protein [Actinoplanes sp.]